jgi:hypothetical protein
MNDVAVKKAEVAYQLDQFYRLNSLADQIQAEGRGLDSERVKETAMVPLRNAQTAADRFVTIAKTRLHLLTAFRD